MVFYFSKKIEIIFFGIIIIFSCLSCQNLNQTQTANQLKIKKNPIKTVIIDKVYFENIASLNYLKAEIALFESEPVLALAYLKKSETICPIFQSFSKKNGRALPKRRTLCFSY